MIAAISHGSRTDISRQDTRQAAGRKATAPPAPPAYDHWSVARNEDGTRLFHVRMPQLRTEVSREVGRRCAESAWRGIGELLREQERKGRTAAIREAAGRLMILDDVGVAGLARHTGKSRNTIYRQLAVLEDIGLVRCVRPPVRLVHGADGRLVAKKGGQERPVRIIVTYDPARHGKPLRKAAAYVQPLNIEPAAEGASYVQPLNTFHECFQTELPPAAETDGIGSAVAGGGEGGLTAAGQDDVRQADPMPVADVMAVLTDEILARRNGLPAPADPPHVAKPAPRPSRTRGQDERPTAEEAAARWNRVDPVVAAALAAKAAAKRARTAGTAGQAPELPSAPARPAGTIPRGQDDAPVRTPEPQVDAEAAWLESMVSNTRREAGITTKDAYRREWHAERAG
jgi:hypothetical protein